MSALALRVLACVSMLCDHIGYLFSGRYPWMEYLRYFGRLAFPLFTYLIVNGYRFTHSRIRYALRLAIFAVISQIPFSLFSYGEPFAQRGNVFFTLLLALLAVWLTDTLKQRFPKASAVYLPALALAAALHFSPISTDYGAKGILLALTFYCFEDRALLLPLGILGSVYYTRIISFFFALVRNWRGLPYTFAPMSDWEKVQFLSLAVLIPIVLYNRKRGSLPKGKFAAFVVKYSFYLFYPAHMLLLYYLKPFILG